MEHKFKRVRRQLDELGYMQVLIPEAIPLVEKLTSDLIQTTESLQKYKTIAKDALEERNSLQLGAEPYKCDNAKLVKECNELHLAFLQCREQNEKLQKDLKRRLASVEREKLDCESQCEKLKKRIRDLEFESARKTDRILVLQNKNLQGGGKTISKSSAAVASRDRNSATSKGNAELSTSMAMADQKIASLSKEIRRLKDEQQLLVENNESYKTQINNRDREIERLSKMFDGGRPMTALNKDCCQKDFEGKMCRLQTEIFSLEKEKSELESRLKESVAKQHEAMQRALNLADRNKQLEQELRDIDQMALTVEADCNNAMKDNHAKVQRLQEKVHDAVLQIQTLEREVFELKRDKQELMSDVDAFKVEKKHLQSVLETCLDEKKRLHDKINQFTIIEHDLNLEIDRLVQTSADQKRRIAELEGRLLAGKFDAKDSKNLEQPLPNTKKPQKSTEMESPKLKTKKASKKQKSSSPKRKGSPKRASHELGAEALHNKSMKVSKKKLHPRHTGAGTAQDDFLLPPNNSPFTPASTVSLSRSSSFEFKNQTNNNLASQKHCPCPNCTACRPPPKCCYCCTCNNNNALPKQQQTLEHYKAERDYYMKEYKRLLEQVKHVPTNMKHAANDKYENSGDLQRKLNEKEQLISSLQHENKTLGQEKHNLMIRLETARDGGGGTDIDYDGLSMRSAMRKVERDREMLKGDIVRLEEERDALRQRLKMATENQIEEHARMEKTLMDAEEHIKRLEQERRDLMQTQGSRRATITNLEEQCGTLKEQLRMSQTELNQQRTLYNQLKTLQEQTDKALADSQGQLNQTEAELAAAQGKIRALEKDRGTLDQEVAALKGDFMAMRGSLAQIDQEKDGLLISVDDKTERVAMLEQELRSKNSEIVTLENTVAELKKKLSLTLDSSSSKEHLLKSATVEQASLRQDLDSLTRAKESALQENRRLQNDLAACTADCKCVKNELDVAKRQVDDLKRQLQHYVAEVKRFEDIMEHKESERNELLDQFRSLSQEAILLENNNHSLETEATQSKVQLSVTLDHVTDLEHKLAGQDGMIATYEKQIADLTAQINSMDKQLIHCRQQQERTEAELVSVRDLCMKLDKQKDGLMRELNDKEDEKLQVDRDMLRLRRESETLQNTLSKDRNSMESLEKLLADARADAVQLKLYIQELESEIQTLKQQLEDTQGRLSPVTATFTYSASPPPRGCMCCPACPCTGVCQRADGPYAMVAPAPLPQKTECKCCDQCPGKSEPMKESSSRRPPEPSIGKMGPNQEKVLLPENTSYRSAFSALNLRDEKMVAATNLQNVPNRILGTTSHSYKSYGFYKGPPFSNTTSKSASYLSGALGNSNNVPSLSTAHRYSRHIT